MLILQGTLWLAQVRATAAEDKDQLEQLETTGTNLASVTSQKEARHQRELSEQPHYVNHPTGQKERMLLAARGQGGRRGGSGELWSSSSALLLNLVLATKRVQFADIQQSVHLIGALSVSY